jgi:site-specific DNA-methyltransferase (adenine-specific)
MKNLPDKSVDAIITDLPYGTTACKWDSVIPFEPMWEAVRHVLKPNGAFVTTASQPFTSALITSNPNEFAYEWIWVKGVSASFALAKKMPMKIHENVLVFCPCGKTPYYRPEMTPRLAARINTGRSSRSDAAIPVKSSKDFGKIYTETYPTTILQYSCRASNARGLHPTQKPLELYRYLIRTYTNPGDTVLDPCMGSGTTCLAAKLEGRGYIGIEKEQKYFEIAVRRLAQEVLPL